MEVGEGWSWLAGRVPMAVGCPSPAHASPSPSPWSFQGCFREAWDLVQG